MHTPKTFYADAANFHLDRLRKVLDRLNTNTLSLEHLDLLVEEADTTIHQLQRVVGRISAYARSTLMVLEKEMDLVRQGQKILAIKQVRERTGATLKEAKDAVELEISRIGLEYVPASQRETR